MTDASHDRRIQRQRERRARRQADHMRTAAVRAAEGDLDDFTTEGSPERRNGVRRAKNEGQRDGE